MNFKIQYAPHYKSHYTGRVRVVYFQDLVRNSTISVLPKETYSNYAKAVDFIWL